MIHRLAREEEESLASRSSADDSPLNESFDKLDLASPGSAMSTVFGSESGTSAAGSKRSSSRSPSRRTSSNISLPFHRRSSSRGFSEDDQRHKQQNKHEDHLRRWLTTGNVIYKSVGLGLMDLVVGFEIVRLAKEKGLGSHIQGFS